MDYAIQNKLVSFGSIYDGYWDDNATRSSVVWYLYRTMEEDSYTAIAVPEDWFSSEALSGMNNCLPYAEFRFYTLRYMPYAKEHHPHIYQGILENDDFRLAFSAIGSLYSDLIQPCGGCTYDQYLTLMTEMQKPEYVQMAALLQP